MPNLFDALPDASRAEIVEALLNTDEVAIERIISLGQTTTNGEWLEDTRNEWVVLLRGAAELVFFEGGRLPMKPGDHVNIPACTRHRVEWTDPKQPSVWLAVYYGRPKQDQ